MSREARMMSGIILITVPTIQYGGYFLLTSLMNKGSGYMGDKRRTEGQSHQVFDISHGVSSSCGVFYLSRLIPRRFGSPHEII